MSKRGAENELSAGRQLGAQVDESNGQDAINRRMENAEHQREYRERRKLERSKFADGSVVDPREQRRADVLSRELARRARLYGGYGRDEDGVPWKPLVPKFRDDFLGGRTITSDEAKAFRNSDAVYVLRLSEFKTCGIPIVGHAAKRNRIESSFQPEFVTYTFNFTIRWGTKSLPVAVTRTAQTGLGDVLVPDTPGWSGPSIVKESVFAELFKLSVTLARYYLWSVSEAIDFVLTDTPPTTPCVRRMRELPARPTILHEHERLHLSISPWVSARTVMKVYRQYQLQLLGRDNRAPRLDRLDLLDFVAQRRHRGQPWRTIFAAWNKAHPEHRYKPEQIRNFPRDFGQIYQLVVGAEFLPALPTARKSSIARLSQSKGRTADGALSRPGGRGKDKGSNRSRKRS